MNRILIIGCGDVAKRTVPLLRGRYRLYGLLRDPARCSTWRTLGVTPILADLDQPTSLHRLAGLADIVLHLAPPPTQGTGDRRTQALMAALSRGTPPSRFIYISTSGVYGDCNGDWVNETRPTQPQTARAERRVAAEKWVREWATRHHVHASILRVPGIYAADRLPVERLRAGTPAIVASEDSYTNHIHADDLARVIVATLRYGRPNRIYHASDDSELKMGEYFDAVADAFHLPRPQRISRTQAQSTLSPMLLSFMQESRRLDNARLKRELKFRLNYPTVADTLLANME
ncbi:Nad-dependent epimerase dehydratase [Ferriphaselus amnicola]|uniref:Nad-dependent epimerase dehydratase n=1 Tax=Ferriphaselus amnicola TaxID=1188319 RepID=A0A2Z6GEU3_9PROT|nr:SDR family oxidoreductase [Ferriphaselus amnicola]BBE52098.1 Nad-dependent epimerase dehydratase [Ferriphaselus amnicola]